MQLSGYEWRSYVVATPATQQSTLSTHFFRPHSYPLNCIINCIFYSPFTTPILLHSQRYTPVYCRFCSAHSAPFYCSSTMCLEIKFYFNLRLACWILASRLASVSAMFTWDPWDGEESPWPGGQWRERLIVLWGGHYSLIRSSDKLV